MGEDSGLEGEFRNSRNHWAAVAEDPPDFDFTVEVRLGPVASCEPWSPDELNRACADAANVLAWHAATTEALLKALEKFQGSVLGGNALYALKQARAVEKYVLLAADQIAETADALSWFNDIVATIPDDLVAASAQAAEMQGRIQPDGTGFSSAELTALQGIGLDPALYPLVAQEIL